jgi:hypothetical protein
MVRPNGKIEWPRTPDLQNEQRCEVIQRQDIEKMALTATPTAAQVTAAAATTTTSYLLLLLRLLLRPPPSRGSVASN